MKSEQAITKIRVAISELRGYHANQRDRMMAEEAIQQLQDVVDAIKKHELEYTHYAVLPK